jgi:hypothetical protein
VNTGFFNTSGSGFLIQVLTISQLGLLHFFADAAQCQVESIAARVLNRIDGLFTPFFCGDCPDRPCSMVFILNQ